MNKMNHDNITPSENSDDFSVQYFMERQKENQQNLMLDRINLLYDQIIEQFKLGNKIIYNPNIFSKLTRIKFISWVIDNNDELFELFS